MSGVSHLPILVFIFGLCIGSFLNVCIWRLPQNISIIQPRSFCPYCKKPIAWYDNIPLVSYIILRGRCRWCSHKISFRYFLIELITGLIFLFSYLKFGLSFDFFVSVSLLSFSLLVSVIDIDYRAIPSYLPMVAVCLALVLFTLRSYQLIRSGSLEKISNIPLFLSFQGMFIAVGFAYFFKMLGDFLLLVYLRLKRQESLEGETEALGLGDVDFMAVLGAFLGFKKAILIFFLAPFLALLYGVYVIIFRRSHLLPYLPYLSLATAGVVFYSDYIFRILHNLGIVGI